MSSLQTRLAKLESAKSTGKGFWTTPFPAFYGRSCPPIWQEKPGTLADFFTEGCGYCDGCNESFCKMDTAEEGKK